MFDWLKNWWRDTPPPPPPDDLLEQLSHHDWVVVPYRIAEACRVSIYTIGVHPELPESLRLWIAEWLVGYNGALAAWFYKNYGEDIFPVLAEITDTVKDVSEELYAEKYAENVAADFDKWLDELHRGEEDGR